MNMHEYARICKNMQKTCKNTQENVPILAVIDRLLAGLKSHRKCANFSLQGSIIDELLAGLKIHRKCVNLNLQESVIDRFLAGLKSRSKCANFGLKLLMGISRLKKLQKMCEFWPTWISY